MSPSSAAAPGWYGKLSSLGDFASRRLEPQWVQACDQWLSACIAGSRQQLGDDWLAAYLDAPLSRFAWAPGVVDDQWWFGVLMPSCDNVGRYFPLVVAAGRAMPPQDRFGLDHLELWWTGAAQAAMQTLAEGADLGRFELALTDLPPWPATRSLATPDLAAAPMAGRHPLPEGVPLTEIAHAFAASQLMQQLRGHSFWWPWRAPRGATSCRIFAGLPAAQDFLALLGTDG